MFHSGVRDTRTFLPTLAYRCTSIVVLAIPCQQLPPGARTPAHSGVPEIVSRERELTFGRAGRQRLLKISNHKHNFHHWYSWPKWPIKVTLAKNDQDQPKLSPLVTLAKNDQDQPKLSPLVTWPKMAKKKQSFHHSYPWPNMTKKKQKLPPLAPLA